MATSATAQETKSPLLEKQNQGVSPPDYDETEIEYRSKVIGRIEEALYKREEGHPEFDYMSYSEYYDRNEALANTRIEPRKNRDESSYQSGTAHDKMFALLASINDRDLSPDISAFDEKEVIVGTLGDAMEDTLLKTNELDGDDEKKLLRQHELLKQGDVFVEEIWDEKWMNDKKVVGGAKKYDGRIKGLTWTQKLVRAFSRPSRNQISGLAVILGDMREYYIDKQPYIATVETMPYITAKKIFGKWERWDNVPEVFDATQFLTTGLTYHKIWNDYNISNGQAVIVRYQDKWDNEFAVIINGVLMTPVGLPLSFVNGYADYSITQQHLEPIHAKFAYGNSLMRILRTKVGVFDEMMRLSVLKTQQSYKPPLLNMSGRAVSSRVFSPGKITQGADLKLRSIIEGMQFNGVTVSELAFIEELKEQINVSSVDETFQGKQTKEQVTAREIIETKRQAQIMLGLTIFACARLEWKLAWLRLFNVLAKWFEPTEEINEIRGELKKTNVFRKVTVEVPIEGRGMGIRTTVPTDGDLPTAVDVKEAEETLERQTGRTTRLIFLKPEAIKDTKLIWQITIKPREKPTNEMSKLMFKAKLADAVQFEGRDGIAINWSELAEEFARIWGVDPKKLFKRAAPQQIPPRQTGPAPAAPPQQRPERQLVPPTTV